MDEGYPTNLAMVHDAPAVLFVRGRLDEPDHRSVAIVGTRTASQQGRDVAYELAGKLASRGVAIMSGLAVGVDTAAHAGALNAEGRTVAVFGTSIEKVYPAKNRLLAEQIMATGACVSQFLPNKPTGRWAFPARNVTMSGLALGTIVVEASETSGAKLQAEAALSHGKRLFLVDELVTNQLWARDLMDDPNVMVSSDPDEILEAVDHLVDPVDHVCM
jgi:DNA processing protein